MAAISDSQIHSQQSNNVLYDHHYFVEECASKQEARQIFVQTLKARKNFGYWHVRKY